MLFLMRFQFSKRFDRRNFCFTKKLLHKNRIVAFHPKILQTNHQYFFSTSSTRTTMTDQDEKKNEILTFPEGYEVPKQWVPKTMDGTMGKMNKPTAGKRFESELPRGEHGLQLYSLGTPNGQKVTILLEELGVDYDAYIIKIMELQQFGSAFVDINPNSKIPALLDYSMADGKSEKPLRLFESASIMLYLAEKEKKFIPTDSSPPTSAKRRNA